MAAGEAERTQRAASSMASGTPATSRQTRPTGGQVGGRAEPGPQQPGPVLEQLHRRVAGRLRVRPGRRVGQAGHLDQPLHARARAAAARSPAPATPGRPARAARRAPRRRRGSCSRLSSTSSSSRPARCVGEQLQRVAGHRQRHPEGARPAWSTTRSAASSGRAGLAPTNDTNTAPSRCRSSPGRGDLHRQPGLADPARADQRHQPAGRVVEQLVQPGQLLLPADQRGERRGSAGARSASPGGRSRRRRRQLGEPAGARRSRRAGRWSPRTAPSRAPRGAGSGRSRTGPGRRRADRRVARNHISARCASSCSGSSSSMRRATSTPAAGVPPVAGLLDGPVQQREHVGRGTAARRPGHPLVEQRGAGHARSRRRNSPRQSRTAASSSSPLRLRRRPARSTSTASTQTGRAGGQRHRLPGHLQLLRAAPGAAWSAPGAGWPGRSPRAGRSRAARPAPSGTARCRSPPGRRAAPSPWPTPAPTSGRPSTASSVAAEHTDAKLLLHRRHRRRRQAPYREPRRATRRGNGRHTVAGYGPVMNRHAAGGVTMTASTRSAATFPTCEVGGTTVPALVLQHAARARRQAGPGRRRHRPDADLPPARRRGRAGRGRPGRPRVRHGRRARPVQPQPARVRPRRCTGRWPPAGSSPAPTRCSRPGSWPASSPTPAPGCWSPCRRSWRRRGPAAEKAGVAEVLVFGEADGRDPVREPDRPRPTRRRRADRPGDRDLAALPYSSGTTGLPKGVELTHANLVTNARQSQAVLGFARGRRGRRRWRRSSTPSASTCPAVQPARPAPPSSPCPASTWTASSRPIQEYRATLHDRGPAGRAGPRRPPAGRRLRPVVAALPRRAGRPRSAPTSSSAAPTGSAAGQPGARHDRGDAPLIAVGPLDAPRRGSVGRLLPNTEARIVDPDSGADLGAGRTGELWLRGPQLMRGYRDRPEATAATIDADGWLHTGDLCYFDDDGYLYVVDRLKELIKYKGYQVAPAELEHLLLRPPGGRRRGRGAPARPGGRRAPGRARGPARAEATRRGAAGVRRRAGRPLQAAARRPLTDPVPRSPTGKLLRRVLVEAERAEAAGAA